MLSENRRLCDVVLALSHQLNRPVCSLDLVKHFEAHPESRPILTQRIGQLLIKAARPAKSSVPRLRQVGLFGSRAFYAPNADPAWDDRFVEYVNRGQLDLFQRLRYPEKVWYLLGGAFDSLARHSLTGWMAEAQMLVVRCPDHPASIVLIQQREQVRPVSATKFQRFIPDDLLSRDVAMRTLQRFVRDRTPHRTGFQVNYNRYLCPLRWPQSALYTQSPEMTYSLGQLKAFMTSKWPRDDENEEEAHALYWALRYPMDFAVTYERAVLRR
jgi:hypothetical protein